MTATPELHTQGDRKEALGMGSKASLKPGTIPNYLSGLVSPPTLPKLGHMPCSSLFQPPLPNPSTAPDTEQILKIFLLT